MSIGISKEQQTAGPGGNGKSRKPKSNKTIGNEHENRIVDAFKEKGINARRGQQNRIGGGMGEADIQAMPGWHIEAKNDKQISMAGIIRQLKEDCPKMERPGFIREVEGEDWIAFPFRHIEDFSFSYEDAAGYEVAPRGMYDYK